MYLQTFVAYHMAGGNPVADNFNPNAHPKVGVMRHDIFKGVIRKGNDASVLREWNVIVVGLNKDPNMFDKGAR